MEATDEGRQGEDEAALNGALFVDQPCMPMPAQPPRCLAMPARPSGQVSFMKPMI